MKRIGRIFAAVLSIGVVLMFTGTAFAYGPAGAPVLTATSTTVAPGGILTCGAANFQPNETVSLVAHSTPVSLGSVKASAAGAWTATLTIPASLGAGAHQIVATGLSSGETATFNFTVLGTAARSTGATATGATATGATSDGLPKAPLAFTGTDTIALTSVAAVALAIGGFLVLGSRRRRQEHVA
jgi:hypothetical protein